MSITARQNARAAACRAVLRVVDQFEHVAPVRQSREFIVARQVTHPLEGAREVRALLRNHASRVASTETVGTIAATMMKWPSSTSGAKVCGSSHAAILIVRPNSKTA